MAREHVNEGRILFDFDQSLSLPNLLESHRVEQPDKVALIQGTLQRTWSESIERMYRIANGLIELGVQPGDKVAMLSRNSMAYSELFAGVLLAGGCAVPMQSMITDESLALMLIDSDARVLVVSAEFVAMTDNFLSRQEQLLPGGLLGFDFRDRKFADFERFLTSQSTVAPAITPAPDAPFNIMYSSGTTGVPKGIVHSQRTRQGVAVGLMTLGVSSNSITLITTPLYSNTSFTIWWPTLCAGGTMILESKFDPGRSLQLIQQHRVNTAMFVPVQYDRILRHKDYDAFDLSSMTLKFCTSAPLRAALKKDIIERFPGELVEFYGLTEGGVGTLFIGSVAKQADKLGSVGPALPGTVLKIINDAGDELSTGEIGEIVGRSSNMSDGYHNRDAANRDMHWRDDQGLLYYRSGDVGYLDEDGWLFLSDRKKDMIISGGFNIYATDLELVLLDHPQVHEAAVVAMPSEQWGETPLAIVVTEAHANCSEEFLRQWANERLGKGQQISKLLFVHELPKSSIGKVLKKQLRTELTQLLAG
ncbi:MAG: class I adenylate-forming enzyme family protein [Pseudomonadota bacterium]